MKFGNNFFFILGVFLLLFQKSWAQRGYNYARPSLGATAGSNDIGGVNLQPSGSLNNALRPIVPALPTGIAATAPGFITSPTAFGTPGATNVGQGATTAFGAFPLQPQRATVPTNAYNAGGVGGSSGVLARPTNQQRTAGGLFGRPQTTQFTSGGNVGLGAAGAGGSSEDYDGVGDYSAIPGVPGVDYPLYSQVPRTSFDCSQQPLPGYYSDVEAQCQVFHICALNRTYSFLCPNGTIFSQEVLVCVWWNQYDCGSAPTLYANNAFIYDYGNRVTPTDASGGYQGGLGGSTTRSQTNFPLATNTARTAGATTAQGTSIFGNTLALRPTVTTGGFGGYTTPITPAPTAGYGSRLSSGRLATQAATATPQTFQNAAAIIPSTAIGGGIRANGNVGEVAGLAGGVGLPRNALQNAQLATSSTNREYLPPTQRN